MAYTLGIDIGTYETKGVLVDSKNRIVDTGPEVPGPQMPRRVDELVH